MGKMLVKTIGTIKIKIDVRDDVYADAKPPHVSLVQNGKEIISHLYLSDINNVVGNDPDTKEAIYWLRNNREEVEKQYRKNNKI